MSSAAASSSSSHSLDWTEVSHKKKGKNDSHFSSSQQAKKYPAPSAASASSQSTNWRSRAVPIEPKPNAAAKGLRSLEESLGALSLEGQHPTLEEASEPVSSAASKVERARLLLIPNVHKDDIHCLLKLPNRTFISGSKDGCLKQWDFKGKLKHRVYEASRIDYKNWITALSSLGPKHWLSGTRNNCLDVWDLEGQHVAELQAVPPPSAHKCKERNLQRILCLTDLSSVGEDLDFSIGWPTQFTTHRLSENRAQRIETVVTDANDWVYAIHPIDPTSRLVITGTRLDLYTKKQEGWTSSLLIEETKHFARLKEAKHRSFISSITPFAFNSHLFGLSIFNGSIQVFDLHKQAVVMEAREHENRVWTIENTAPHCFASCADDGRIKLWDMRAPAQSVITWLDNEKYKGRVSVLLSTDENILVSGSCPDDVHSLDQKAQLSFWDLRTLGGK
jgi:WD40 repeat protein